MQTGICPVTRQGGGTFARPGAARRSGGWPRDSAASHIPRGSGRHWRVTASALPSRASAAARFGPCLPVTGRVSGRVAGRHGPGVQGASPCGFDLGSGFCLLRRSGVGGVPDLASLLFEGVRSGSLETERSRALALAGGEAGARHGRTLPAHATTAVYGTCADADRCMRAWHLFSYVPLVRLGKPKEFFRIDTAGNFLCMSRCSY